MQSKTLGRIMVVDVCNSHGLLIYQLPGFAQEQAVKVAEEAKPDRLITMAVEYPGIEVPAEENVSMNIIFNNKGKADENVDVWVASNRKDGKPKSKPIGLRLWGICSSSEKKEISFEATRIKRSNPENMNSGLRRKRAMDNSRWLRPLL